LKQKFLYFKKNKRIARQDNAEIIRQDKKQKAIDQIRADKMLLFSSMALNFLLTNFLMPR
jgi:hypothetical protein